MTQSPPRAEESASIPPLSTIVSSESGNNTRRRAIPAMAEPIDNLNLSRTAHAKPLITTPILPLDVLLMVFEQIRDTPSFPNLRLVTKQFKALVTPIFYRHITLTTKILSNFIRSKDIPFSTSPHFEIRHYIRHYTENISISTKVDSHLAARLLRSLKNLRQITWSVWDISLIRSDLEETVFHCPIFHEKWPKLRLSIESVGPILQPSNNIANLPWLALRLTSCKTINITGRDNNTSPRLKHTLLESLSLETLHLINTHARNADLNWQIKDGERLPPIKELAIDGYRWPSTPPSAANFWVFSQITHLDLKRVPILPFLKTVKPGHLRQLRVFKTCGYCQSSEKREVNKLMRDLLNSIDRLEELNLSCMIRKNGILSAIFKHGSSLRSLLLRDYCDFKSPSWVTLSLEDLEMMCSQCPNLMELDIEMPPIMSRPAPAIDYYPFTAFRNLRRLKLTSRVGPFAPPDVEKWFHDGGDLCNHHLLVQKQGAKFESVIVSMLYQGNNAEGHWAWLSYISDYNSERPRPGVSGGN